MLLMVLVIEGNIRVSCKVIKTAPIKNQTKCKGLLNGALFNGITS